MQLALGVMGHKAHEIDLSFFFNQFQEGLLVLYIRMNNFHFTFSMGYSSLQNLKLEIHGITLGIQLPSLTEERCLSRGDQVLQI